MDTADLSIAAMGRALRDGSVTSEQLTRDALRRIAAQDAGLHAFVLLTPDRALADAHRADSELKASIDRGPFHGIPYALKDIYDTGGIRTTCHSKLRLDNVPAADSVVAAKFTDAGGVLLGKLATHEFALGGPSFDLPFPPSRNPWNVEHITGGSSSGSATAIAARMVRMAMGSDTGGSIRGPAAWCGLAGIKPTYGRVSRRGVFPLSWTLDHCGPLSAATWRTPRSRCRRWPATIRQDAASADVPVPDYRAGLSKASAACASACRARSSQRRRPPPTSLAGIDRTRSRCCASRRHGRGHRAAGLCVVLRRRAGDHDGGGFRHPPGRHADPLAGLRRDHRQPVRARRGDHRGGLHQRVARAARTDRCGQCRAWPVMMRC